MDVDVIILSYNRLELTLETIQNVNQQTGVSALIWLVDQGSSDDCLLALRELANSNPHIQLIENGYNAGVAGGRNIGMRQGTSEIIVSIDNDAVFGDNEILSRLVPRFQEDPALGAIGFRIDNYFTGEYDRGSWSYPRSLFAHRDEKFLTTRFCGAGHALRRSALAKTNMYDDSLFFYWEELDLSYQLLEAGYTIIYDPSFVVRHRVSPEERTSWGDKRYYFLVRNAIYIDFKYFRSRKRVALLSLGYLVKGIYNGVFKQAISAVRDAQKMITQLPDAAPLNPEAQRYIEEHDLKYRGNLWQRIRREALERLP